jgi:hypothetical protein
MSTLTTVCIPLETENPLRLSPLFTDYWGDYMASFTRQTDVFSRLGCYAPRCYHAPDSTTELNGVAAGGYIEYLLSLPVGSFLCGFLHTTISVPDTAPNNPITPPAQSGFAIQITDLSIDKQLFSKPVPEAWFLNDYLQPVSANPPYANSGNGFVAPVTPRLLPVPLPIVPPGQLLVEFWNQLADPDTNNKACQMTFVVMVPVGQGKF